MKLFLFVLRHSPGVLLAVFVIGAFSGAASTGLLAIVHISLQDLDRASGTLAWSFAGLCLLAPLSRLGSQLLLVRLGQGTVRRLRLQLTQSILATELRSLERLGEHRLMAALTSDVNTISGGLVRVSTLNINLAIVAGCLCYLAWLSPLLLLVLLAVLVLGVLSYQYSLRAAARRFGRAREKQDRLYEYFRALTEGIRELKLQRGRSGAFFNQVSENAGQLYRLHLSAMALLSVSSSWGHLLFFIAIGVLVFALPSGFVLDSSVLTGYCLTLLYMMNPMQSLMDALPELSRSGVALNKVERLGLSLESPADEQRPDAADAWAPERWDLELSGVLYHFEARENGDSFQLGPLDLKFRPGELVFLVGGNGSGKTTLAKLLTGLYAPTEGEIRLGGRAVSGAMRSAYAQNFSAVFANPYLFGDLAAVTGPGADAQVRGYLRDLQLSGKVEVRNGELSTLALSRGQRKRLALLVSFLEDRPFHLYDEWAADQDPAFREFFYERILPDLKGQGKTVFVISHDDRYYSAADRIIKLDYGRIEYDGSFESFGRA